MDAAGNFERNYFQDYRKFHLHTVCVYRFLNFDLALNGSEFLHAGEQKYGENVPVNFTACYTASIVATHTRSEWRNFSWRFSCPASEHSPPGCLAAPVE